MMEATNRSAWADVLTAVTLATVLTATWAWRGWSDLSALRLPDADDLMRLQQIRDWLGGQAFADLTQYRLGADGVPMHWSRLADLVPAAIIWSLQDLIGRNHAELVAVIGWPAMLLATAIMLTGRIGRLVGGDEIALPAMIVGAIAYPASTVFLPGRIDHHGLQLVLLLAMLIALVGRASVVSGIAAGTAVASSLLVGMEMVPLLAAAAAMVIGDWVLRGRAARDRMLGLGLGLAATTLIAGDAFRTIAWSYPACDGFTAISARAALLASLVPIALGLLPSRTSARVRSAFAGASAVALVSALIIAAPQCLSPYGGVDPALQRLWLTRVAEAQGLFAAPGTIALGYGGLAMTGLAATAWLAWQTRARGWILLLVLQLAAALVMLIQLRGAYAGALLAAPALGAVIVAARRRGALPLAAAWAGSAGMFYPLAAQAMVRSQSGPPAASCTAPDLIGALGKLAPGTVMAPVDTGAPAIAATNQRLIAGAYHRDGAGDLAMYHFYRGTPDAARTIAHRLHTRWVVACDGFADVPAPFAQRLLHGTAPIWLVEVASVGSGARIFAVADRPAAASRSEPPPPVSPDGQLPERR